MAQRLNLSFLARALKTCCCNLSGQVVQLGALLREGLVSGEVRALPASIFGSDDAASAFRSLASGMSDSLSARYEI